MAESPGLPDWLGAPSWLLPAVVVRDETGRRFWIDSILSLRDGTVRVCLRGYRSCLGNCMDTNPCEVSRENETLPLDDFLKRFEPDGYDLAPYLSKEESWDSV